MSPAGHVTEHINTRVKDRNACGVRSAMANHMDTEKPASHLAARNVRGVSNTYQSTGISL